MSDLDDEEKKWLQHAVDGSADKIERSGMFASLFSSSYRKDVMLDKPICVIVLEGQSVPEHLKKIAFAIEHIRSTDEMQGAWERIRAKAEELGL